MEYSTERKPKNIIIDSIHGDIHLNDREVKVINTPTFQRLRQIKQLQMSHLTYPNATHTRFMHSLGVLGIMIRVRDVAEENGISLSEEEFENLRLAALLHDVGHYPYSHLMEGIEKVGLVEEKINSFGGSNPQKTLKIPSVPYPEHEALGVKIVLSQQDILSAIGSKERTQKIADLFSGNAPESPQLSKFITSSLDLDRLDYLQRDAYATGLPYGRIDLNYLLNSLQMSPTGEIGVCDRAIPAVEQFLLARYFMHRTVYYHRTTVAFEEGCRQLLRRLRDEKKCEMPSDGQAIEEIVTTSKLRTFTDAFVDQKVQQAIDDSDEVIKYLALSIQSRNAPKLLKEVLVLEEKGCRHHAGATFERSCYACLEELAKKYKLPLGLFLFYKAKPITFEKSDARYRIEEIERMSQSDQRKSLKKEKEVVQIFAPGATEPCSIFDFEYSFIKILSNLEFHIYRLYFVPHPLLTEEIKKNLIAEIKDWDK